MPWNRGQQANSEALKREAETIDITRLKRDFPVLGQKENGKRLVYIDTASTAQKPRATIDQMRDFLAKEYANVTSDTYSLGQHASQRYEEARDKVRGFINAKDAGQISFLMSATEAIHVVAAGFERDILRSGDEVITTAMEHNANLAPWLTASKQTRAKVKVIPLTADGDLDLDRFAKLMTQRTKLVSVAHVSNVLGTVNPVKKIVRMAHERDIPVLVDGAQAVPHMPVDVRDIGCDFYVFAGHKLYGPTGIGILYGTREWLDRLPPHQGGSENVQSISFEEWTPMGPPRKFEAGVPPIAEAIGLGATVDYLTEIGMERIDAYEAELAAYAIERVGGVDRISILGTPNQRVSILSFSVNGAQASEVSKYLDREEGIATRAGTLGAGALLQVLGLQGAVRASFGLHNTRQEVDLLVDTLERCVRSLPAG